MLSETPAVVDSTIATCGPTSLVQGVYGVRGNLELVACDAIDGLWVFWFNADLPTDPLSTPDVPPGQWSAGLHFAHGGRFADARILQSTLGPNHLEVLALTDQGVLQSWYWSPGPGFQRRATDAAAGVARFATSHRDGFISVTVEDLDADLRQLVSTPDGYPARRWQPATEGPGLPDPAAAHAAALATGVAADDIQPDTARCARSTRDGGTTELTWRDVAGRLRHLGIRD